MTIFKGNRKLLDGFEGQPLGIYPSPFVAFSIKQQIRIYT